MPAVAGTLFVAVVIAGCSGPTARPATASSTTVAGTTAPPTIRVAPSTPAPLATSTATTWASVCGTVTDFVKTTSTTDGAVILTSPGRSPLKLTLTAARINPEGQFAGYVCVALDAGVPYPIFAGLGVPRTEGFVAEGTYPATNAKPAPTGFVVPQSCAFVAPPVVGADQTDWKVDCGAEANRSARGTLGAALGQQGWTACGPAAATELFVKGTIRIVVVESSLAPGDYPRFSQSAQPAAGCG